CLAATYALASAGRLPFRWCLLRDGFLSYRSFIDRPRSMPLSYRLLSKDEDRMTVFDQEIPPADFPLDALRSFDLPQILGSSRALVMVVNPIDGDRDRLPEADARRLLPAGVRVISDDHPDARIGVFVREAIARADREPGDGGPVRPRETI